MKKVIVFLLLITGFTAWAQDIPPRPNPPKLVNDFTGTLTADQVQTLENKLDRFDDSTSTQIAVVLVKSIDNDATDYATELGRKWGVGGEKNNNGVVLLICTDPNNHALSIAPGYGLEGALPDITCKQIIDYTIVPRFKGSDYYRGIDEGTDEIIKAVKGIYKAPANYRKKGGTSAGKIVLIVILIIVFLGISGGSKGGGGFMSRRGYRGFGGPVFWGGGGWSGGSSGGGGGGGFGGFGGGSFGGGGASGSW